MAARSPAELRLRSAREQVEQVCGLLSEPSVEALTRSAGMLESACAALKECQDWVGADLAEARRLEQAVCRSSRILQSAQAFHANWMRSWEIRNVNYAPGGVTAPPAQRGLLFLAG